MSILSLLQAPWAIAPEKLQEMQAIYATHLRGDKIDIDALEARMGRPLANEQQDYQVLDGGVAVLPIEGVLAPKMNLFMRISGGSSTQMMQQQIESAAADPRVKSLILSVDSPGGSVHGMPELAGTVAEAAAIKPVVTLATANIASAAYYVGCAANAVFITGPTVLAGSIGVVATHDYSPQAPGRALTEVSAGKYKRIATTNEPLTAEGRAYMQAQVDHLYSVFVDAVASSRGVSADQVLQHMADGRVFVGQQAINAGLVDGVSTFNALVESMATNPDQYAKRRKASIAVPVGAPQQSKSAGAAPKDKTSTRESKGTAMSETLTRASFEQDHAPLFAQLQAEFTALGATQERARIQAVPGHEKLLATMAMDGTSTGAHAALAVLSAEKAQRAAAATAHANDAPAAAPASAAPADKPEKTNAEKAAEAQAYAKEHGIEIVAALKHLGYAS
jgi:signal peptide peptidase SppA